MYKAEILALKDIGEGLLITLKIGVTLDTFQLSGTFACLRDKLNRSVSTGEIVLAVSRSIRLDTPSGPEAVFNLYDDKSSRTSLWEQLTFDRTGPEFLTRD